MRKLIPVVLLTCFTSLLFGDEVEPVDFSLLETREINGEEIYFLKNKKEPFTGKSVVIYDNGNKWVVNYSKGKIDGLSDYHYPSGKKAYEDFHENGKMVYAKSWKPDGSICDVTKVINGEGLIQSYHPNGPVEYRANIKNGYYEGLETWWHENGEKKVEVNNKDGKKDGLTTHWYENGEKQGEVNWKDGKQDGLTTHWYDNGKKEEESNYKDGKQDGLGTWWHENGEKKVEVNYKDGEIDGLGTWWYENGQKEKVVNYKDGKQDGLTTHWYENGKKKEDSNWKNGKAHGASIYYDEKGKETLRRHYLKGALTFEYKSP